MTTNHESTPPYSGEPSAFMPKASPEWTPEERLKVIAWMNERLMRALLMTGTMPGFSVLAVVDSTLQVSTRPASFLEANRATFENGGIARGGYPESKEGG